MEETITTIQDILTDLLGEYTPIPQEVTESRTEAYVLVDASGAETLQEVTLTNTYTQNITNWAWFGSIAIFIVMLYCILRMIGGLISCKQ